MYAILLGGVMTFIVSTKVKKIKGCGAVFITWMLLVVVSFLILSLLQSYGVPVVR